MSTSPILEIAPASSFVPEQEYIVDVLLRDFLGLDIHVMPRAQSDTLVISLDGKSVCLPQTLLAGDEREALAQRRPASIRELDVRRSELPSNAFGGASVPILYGDPDSGGRWITRTSDDVTIHADVLGSSFFLLTRLEEVGSQARDEYGLFPAAASLAALHGFLGRPLVDEYVRILWCVLQSQWPELRRSPRSFRTRVSHDVDRPFAYDHAGLRDRVWTVRNHARTHVLPGLGGSRILNAVAASLGLPHNDPFSNFEWLVELDESHGHRATYYFLCGGDTQFDGRYDVAAPAIRSLLRTLANAGHEIGLHGSFATIDDAPMMAAQRSRLAEVLADEGLPADVLAGRQHYLRWRAPVTWRVAEEAGLRFDSSVGYNDRIGFRAGTSFDYPVFDVERRRPLRLRERPLHVMDRALQDMDEPASLQAVDNVRREVARHGGTLEVLWHNNVLAESPVELRRYEHAIARTR